MPAVSNNHHLKWSQLLQDAFKDAWIVVDGPAEVDHALRLRNHLVDWFSTEEAKSFWSVDFRLGYRRPFRPPAEISFDTGVDGQQWDRVIGWLRGGVVVDVVECLVVPDAVSSLVPRCGRCVRDRPGCAEPVELPERLTRLETFHLFAFLFMARARRVDAARQSQFLMLHRQRRALDASSLERSPGDLVTSSGRAPRGPDSPRTTQFTVSRGELFNAA